MPDQALIEDLDFDSILDEMQTTKSRPKNAAAEGLIEDANQHIEEIEDEKLLDPVLLASVQKVEHYCIAAWGTAASMGRLLGKDKVVKTMERVLGEGKRYDEEMTKLARIRNKSRHDERGRRRGRRRRQRQTALARREERQEIPLTQDVGRGSGSPPGGRP